MGVPRQYDGVPAGYVRSITKSTGRGPKGSSLMPCPGCGSGTIVLQTRRNDELKAGNRRRCCVDCGERFTTYEIQAGVLVAHNQFLEAAGRVRTLLARMECLVDEIIERGGL